MSTYITSRINDLLFEQRKTRKALKEYLGLTNDTTIKQICDGGDIYVSRLCDIAGFFGVGASDFFDDAEQQKKKKTTTLGRRDDLLVQQVLDSERKLHAVELEKKAVEVKHIEEMYELKLDYEKQLADLREGLARAKAKADVYANEMNVHSNVNHFEYGMMAAEES